MIHFLLNNELVNSVVVAVLLPTRAEPFPPAKPFAEQFLCS